MYFSVFERELLDSSPDYYYFCGLESFELKHMNKALCDYMNMELEFVVGKKCYEVIYGLKRQCGWCLNAELKLDSMQIASIETKYKLRDKTFFCSIFTIADYQNQDPEEIHVTRFLPDKTLNDCFSNNMT